MPRYYTGSKLTFTTTVKNNGILTDAASIYFKWKVGLYGTETTVTPTRTTTGTYTVDVVPLVGGNLYTRWDTDGTFDVATEPVINIHESAFA
jgi:hypothetical protein